MLNGNPLNVSSKKTCPDSPIPDGLFVFYTDKLDLARVRVKRKSRSRHK